MTSDFLEVDALTPDRLAALLDRALAWKKDPAVVSAALAGWAPAREAAAGAGVRPATDRPDAREMSQACSSFWITMSIS